MSILFPEKLPKDSILGGSIRLIGFIDSGGMANVYRGEHQVLGIDVAIKVLKAESGSDERANWFKRCMQEAQVAARINHPNVVRILEFNGSMHLTLPDG